MIEKWEDLVFDGYDTRYQISNLGRVKSVCRYSEQGHLLPEIIMKQYDNGHGYKYVDLYSGKNNAKKFRCYVHRLVAEYFVDNPNNLPEVDHIDTNPSNNVYTNLRWCTHKSNYLNEITKKKQIDAHKNDKPSKEQIEKISKKISVYKDGVLVYTFNSYKDLDANSKKVLGKQLWNVYARQVIKGLRDEYNGYTFSTP